MSEMDAIKARGITLKMIQDRCDEVGDCWIWTNAISTAGYPIIRQRPGPCLYVRRVAVALDGRPAAHRQPVICTCDEKRCCNPAHLKPSTPTAVGRAAAKKGRFSTKSRGAKIAAARRASASSKITTEIAQEIRMSTETGPVLATRYGIHRSMVGNIKRGTAWRDYSSPFSGLGARS